MSDLDDAEQDFQDPIELNTNMYARKRLRSNYGTQEYIITEFDLTEAHSCTLCNMPWTNNGPHTTFNLKCGHVFGKTCIQKHIRESITKVNSAQCPICNHTVTKSEPRRIWANIVLPCEEEDLAELKKEHKEADQVLAELARTRDRIFEEINKVKEELNRYQTDDMLVKKVNSQPTSSQPKPMNRYVKQRTLSIPNEKYKVVDLIPERNMALVSVVKSSSFGIRKVNMNDESITEFIPNHKAQIKDIKHTINNDTILSTGFDKTLKLTSLGSNQVVQTYSLQAPGWSCATNPLKPNLIYCGVTNNTLLVFDIRNTSRCVNTLKEPCATKEMSPIHTVEVIDNKVICSNLAHNYYWVEIDGTYRYQTLQNEENQSEGFKTFSVSYANPSILTSLRNKSSTRYLVEHFENETLVLDWRYDEKEYQQRTLTKNTIFTRDEELFIGYAQEDTVKIRNKESLLQTIKAYKPVLDIKSIHDQGILTVLTEDELQIFKFT